MKSKIFYLLFFSVFVLGFNLGNANFFNKELLQMSLKEEYRPTLLIFFSKSVPINVFKNYCAQSEKLSLKTYFVYRGWNKDNLNELLKLKTKQKDIKFEIKIHPFLFRELNVTKVPTIVYGICPVRFNYKKCRFLFKMRGDMSLDYFFERASEYNYELAEYVKKLEGE